MAVAFESDSSTTFKLFIKMSPQVHMAQPANCTRRRAVILERPRQICAELRSQRGATVGPADCTRHLAVVLEGPCTTRSCSARCQPLYRKIGWGRGWILRAVCTTHAAVAPNAFGKFEWMPLADCYLTVNANVVLGSHHSLLKMRFTSSSRQPPLRRSKRPASARLVWGFGASGPVSEARCWTSRKIRSNAS